MRELSLEDFAERVGESFELDAGGSPLRLTLEAASPLGHSPRPGGAFSLLFRGPVDPVLPQAIYPFALGGEAVDIFIVPIASEPAGVQYEAIFN